MIVIHNIYPKRRIITAQWKRNFETFNHKFRGDHSHEFNADVPLLFVCMCVENGTKQQHKSQESQKTFKK